MPAGILTPTLPVPRTWAAGDLVSAPRLRADVSDAVALLSQPPLFIGTQLQSVQNVPNGINTDTAIILDSETIDTWNGHNIGNNPTQYFPQLAGWYLCEGTFPLQYSGGAGMSATGIFAGTVGVGSTSFGGQRLINATNIRNIMTSAKMVQCTSPGKVGTSGDFVGMWASQSSGSGQTPTESATRAPTLMVRWKSANTGTHPLSVPSNPSWPTPPTVLSSSFLNTNVRDTINFLIYPPIMEAFYSASGSLASQAAVPTTGTAVALGSETVDNYNAFSGSTWTAPVGGLYYVYGQVALTTGANTQALAAGITINSNNYNSGTTFTWWGGTLIASTNATSCVNTRRRLRLNQGDTLQLAAFQNDSGSASAAYSNSGFWIPQLIVLWESA